MSPLLKEPGDLQLWELGEVLLQPSQAYCTQRLLQLLGWEIFEKSPGLQDSW